MIVVMVTATLSRTLFALSMMVSASADAGLTACWKEAEATYNIPVAVLAAVAKHESGLNASAIHRNENGTVDIGLMQINSSHLPTLARYGIDRQKLYEPCTNLMVGAWILAGNAAKLGWNWNAIGAYNVGCGKLEAQECARRRAKYAWKIHAALQRGAVGSTVPLRTAQIANNSAFGNAVAPSSDLRVASSVPHGISAVAVAPTPLVVVGAPTRFVTAHAEEALND